MTKALPLETHPHLVSVKESEQPAGTVQSERSVSSVAEPARTCC